MRLPVYVNNSNCSSHIFHRFRDKELLVQFSLSAGRVLLFNAFVSAYLNWGLGNFITRNWTIVWCKHISSILNRLGLNVTDRQTLWHYDLGCSFKDDLASHLDALDMSAWTDLAVCVFSSFSSW